jgi:RNA polymerase sigma factor, sigma-70 family
MANIGLNALLKSIRNKSELIPAEEEVPLIKKAQAGDRARKKIQDDETVLNKEEYDKLSEIILEGDDARNRMIQGNQRLVIDIVKRYTQTSISTEDLIQEGNLGLFRAIQKFDVKSGNKFGTYATFWVRQNINRHISAHSRSIRIPYNMSELATKYNKAYSELEKEYRREPTVEELAKYLKISVSKVNQLVAQIAPTTSLDMEMKNSENHRTESFGDTVPSTFNVTESLEIKERNKILNKILDSLTDRERDIILRVSGIGTKDGKREYKNALAKEYGLPIQQMNSEIKKIENKIKKQLKEHSIGMDDF